MKLFNEEFVAENNKYDHEFIHFVKSFSSDSLLSVFASCLRQSNNKRMVNMLCYS